MDMTQLLTTHLRKFHIYKNRHLKHDFISAIVVFLVAIPLCLGTALASGAPLFSGILSGIIGGIIVGILSGSQVSVSGPAAGMAAVVLAAITQLHDFNAFLLALVLAGGLQMLLGAFRAGFVAEYVPSNVVQGLLCAIGLLLIFKQLPLAFTLSPDLTALKLHLLDMEEGFSFKPLSDLTFHINSGALILSLVSLGVLIFFDKTHLKWLKVVPGPIVVVILGITLNSLFIYADSYLMQNSPQLVNIPNHGGFMDFLSQMQGPNWSAWSNPQVYLYAALLAIVASLETLLNIKASEKLDPLRRSSSKDKELLAQGVGNFISGLVGGIPITSVIVRTSVNIQTGARTKFSTIFHGCFILMAVMLIPHMLNKIPLCSLAIILIYTGYKLTKPAIYITIFRQGWDRFIPFVVTVIGIVTFNLLSGMLIGLLISLFYILKSNSQARLDIIKEFYPKGITNRLVLPQQTTFLNKASLVAELEAIPTDSQLIIDARYSDYIDKEITEFIKEFQREQAPHKHISLNLIGFKDYYDIHDHINFINVTTYDVQAILTPREVLAILKEGNQRFLNDTKIHRSLKSDIKHTATTQHPIAVVLGCIDSRVPVETIFDMGFGDLFCIRIAGNVVNEDILASIEYACHVIGAKLVVVLGHTRCGAIQAACDGVETGHITQLLAKIKPAIAAQKHMADNHGPNDMIATVTELNIANTLLGIYQKSSILRRMTEECSIGLVGAIYDVNSGHVTFKDFSSSVSNFEQNDASQLPQKLRQLFVTHD